MDSAILRIAPGQSNQGQQQKDRQGRGGPGKWRAGAGETERQRLRRHQIVSKRARDNLVSAGFQSLDRKLRVVRYLLPDCVPGVVVKREGVLKLLGESAAAVRRNVKQQAVLRIVELQA